MGEQVHGRTPQGEPVTDEVVERWSAEAEAGYPLARIRPRGRPRMGTAPARTFPVRLDPDLRAALDRRAAHDRTSASEVVREALRTYLAAS